MLDLVPIKEVIKWLLELGSHKSAEFIARFLVPAAILLLTVSGTTGLLPGVELSGPISISELKTEILSAGVTSKPGIAIIIEPVASEFHIEVAPKSPRLWTSIDERTARANASRLLQGTHGMRSQAPFLGVQDPVIVVIEGPVDQTVQFPGGTKKVKDLLLRSRRSAAVLAGVVIACFFAIGMSSAIGISETTRLSR